MTIHLNKVNGFGGGNGGGGGSSSFPTIVTDSGSSLPSASGYQVGDTFLNTSDKKIYKTSADGYGINSVFDYTISNNLLEPTTGILDFSGGQKSLSINSYTVASYSLICPFVATNIEDTQCILQAHSSGYPANYYNVMISSGQLVFKMSPLCNIEANKTYIIEIVVTGSQYASNRSGTIKVYTEEGTKIAEEAFTYSDNSIVVHFGSFIKAGPEGSFFSGQIFRNVGEYNFKLGSNDIVVVDTSSLNWDNGVALQNKTEYADKTNGALYLYENSELVKIPQSKIFTDVYANSWVSDSTYADYGYKCELSCSGVTANMFAQVIFAPAQADSGNYATVCLTGNGTVTIYSKVNDTISIPSIVVMGV